MNLYCSKLYVFLLLVFCRLVSGLSPLFISRKVKKKFAFDGIGKKWVSTVELYCGIFCVINLLYPNFSSELTTDLLDNAFECFAFVQIEKGVSYSMDFSGGILLATCFIHMIPEVRENLLAMMKERYTFPYAETLVCIGFFTVYVIEEIVRHIVEDKSWHHHHHGEKSDVLIAVKETESPFTDVKLNNGREVLDGADSTNHIQLVSTNNKTTEINVMVKDDANECNNNTKNMNGNNLKHFLLVSALSFHSVMEGVALGLATSLQDLWYLFLAVMAHECTILLCVGIELVANCSSTSTIVKYMAVLALVSPAGKFTFLPYF